MRLALAIVALALSAAAHAQMHKWVDKDGKVHYTDTPPPADARQQTTISKPGAAGGDIRQQATVARPATAGGNASAAPGNLALDFEANGADPIRISANGAQAIRRGADVEIRVQSMLLVKNIADPEVEYDLFKFTLSRRGPNGAPQHVGSSERESSIRGKLTDTKTSATYHNVVLVYPGAAAQCQETCFVALSTWVGYGTWQTGASTKNAELRFK